MDERLSPDEEKRALRYGWSTTDIPHEPTLSELLAIEDDEHGSYHAIQPTAADVCPHCGGSGRRRAEAES